MPSNVSTFSRRLPADAELNALSRAIAALRAAGTDFVDLTGSNPTHAGIAYPAGLLAPLSAAAGLSYDPDPRGLPAAREAIADDAGRREVTIDPAHVVLSASTSESYSWLFKLLCNTGDCVLVPRPSYPLFEQLTQLEGVRAIPYDLEYHGRWEIDFDSLEAGPAEARAVLVVSPNNPTGQFVLPREAERLTRLCRDRGWALIADEVFADYPLDAAAPLTDLAARLDVLTFSLGGASKSLGLPQVKLGWMVVGGPAGARDAALHALELIADTFLSVGTPVQVAAPALLRDGAAVRAAIHDRVRGNLETVRRSAAAFPSCTVLPVEGGWSAVLRVPATRSEETLVLDLLQHERILVHPGYFFDFVREAYIVISLLPPAAAVAEAIGRVLRFAAS
jgi:aspartate/methionine/tyrosine aminotransferase